MTVGFVWMMLLMQAAPRAAPNGGPETVVLGHVFCL
jgi:hypothetical protein